MADEQARRDEEERVHRVGDQQRPTGGPFGPAKKKKAWERQGGTGNRTGDAAGGGGRKFERPFNKFGPKQPHPYRQAGGPPGRPPQGRPVPAKQTDWSEVAEWYDELVGDDGSEYHREVVLPGTMKLLGDVKGKKILDVACGQGVLSRLLLTSGAEVTGIDAADELIAAARERGPAEIRYVVGDAVELKAAEDNAYDAAACLLAIQNIHPPQGVFNNVARALKPGGTFVVVMMHPAFRSPKTTHWGWVEGVQFRRVDKYLLPRKEPIVTHPGKKTGEYTWTFHRPIGDYVGYMRKAGLLVDAMEEWASHKNSNSGPRAAAENVARKEIPMFLALRGVKVERPIATRTEASTPEQVADV